MSRKNAGVWQSLAHENFHLSFRPSMKQKMACKTRPSSLDKSCLWLVCVSWPARKVKFSVQKPV